MLEILHYVSEITRIWVISYAIILMLLTFYHYSKKNLTDGTTLAWGLFSLAMLIGGIHPYIWRWGDITDWRIYILSLLILTFLIAGMFVASILISNLKMECQELTIYVSLLLEENEKMLGRLQTLDGGNIPASSLMSAIVEEVQVAAATDVSQDSEITEKAEV